MSASVTAMNTAKTASSTATISDWARSTSRAPTILIATIASTTAVVNRLSHAAPASSPTNSVVA